MGREIKFRAFEPDSKEMVHFDNSLAARDMYQAKHLMQLMANEHPKGKDLLMQYVGMADTDGADIYEGDILVDTDCGGESFDGLSSGTELGAFIGSVIFEDGAFVVKIPGFLSREHISDYDWKVIGNIHENPELLKTTAQG